MSAAATPGLKLWAAPTIANVTTTTNAKPATSSPADSTTNPNASTTSNNRPPGLPWCVATSHPFRRLSGPSRLSSRAMDQSISRRHSFSTRSGGNP